MIKMYKLSRTSGGFIQKFMFAIILVMIFSIVLTMFGSSSEVNVTACELTSDNVINEGRTWVRITSESKDEQSDHQLKIEFSSHELVTFFLGASPLEKQNGVWIYTEQINPKAIHTQEFGIVPTLEFGVNDLTYGVNVVVYQDGNEIYQNNLDLRVYRP